MFSGRLYRQHCSYHPNLGVFAKDVCDVLRMQKARADDETPNGANKNILPCDERRVVLAVMELLNELDHSEDVRPVLDGKFGLKKALDDLVTGW